MINFKPFERLACAALLTASCATTLAQDGPQRLSAIKLSVGVYMINAELAQTPDQRATGLMFRKSMAVNEGMLFAFKDAGQQCFWMKNTLIPLDVAFVGDDGSIVNTERMLPQTLDSHCSEKPVRFVLEMSDGWFAKRGIKPGARLHGAPFGN